ncbi:LacI family DNA-binding transcriptional regulator [Silvibacterium dinghuense]|uniref:LacI family transcriptional regulator n=1 Tax=Silvibacterium dinghuense TaxID=1560006 RepID=A0A4Q1SD03_9BACT|nr:LacI family DNA-binding transcriptional regulator [Silvibacterium dinghuense]RXS95096.1 LacI family transcriptional regulator [Silvibacterium dinghuense]
MAEKKSAEKGLSGGKEKTDLKTLARHLDISQTTISRVLNGTAARYRISEATQQRVLEAARKFNYQANVLASSLRSKRSRTIGVMVPEISEGYSSAVLSGIEDELLFAGYFYFVVSHRHRTELLRQYPSLLLSRAVEGIIAIDSDIQADLSVPVVAVSGHRNRPSVVNIELDHQLAAHHALEHLKQLGHRRIAFIKGQTFSSDTRSRWRAICKVAAELGLEIDPQLVVQLQDDGPGVDSGRTATAALLERGQLFTAIFAFNDLAAIGAITLLRETGLEVPRHISVVGFDDILGAATNNPPLTTVRQPLKEMGRVAAKTLLHMLQSSKDGWPKHSIRILPGFVERHSTAPPAVPPRNAFHSN